jgi:hypothetical protein
LKPGSIQSDVTGGGRGGSGIMSAGGFIKKDIDVDIMMKRVQSNMFGAEAVSPSHGHSSYNNRTNYTCPHKYNNNSNSNSNSHCHDSTFGRFSL